MTRMAGLDWAVMCNLNNIFTHTHTRGGSEDAREEVTPTSNQQPQPQDPTLTPQRDRYIMRRTTVQGQEARGRIEEGRGEAKERNKRVVQYISTQNRKRIERKQRKKHKELRA